MKKIMFTLSVLFVVLTFVGAGYVLYNAGSVNAGYAVRSIHLLTGRTWLPVDRKYLSSDVDRRFRGT